MRDPNFRTATSTRHLALGKTRFFDPQFFDFWRNFKGLKRSRHVGGCEKLLRAPRRVLKYCIQTNWTIADKMRTSFERGSQIHTWRINFGEWFRVPVSTITKHWEARFGLARLSLLRSVESRILICVRLSHMSRVFRMLWSAISALFLSYYRVPTRPEWRERDTWLLCDALLWFSGAILRPFLDGSADGFWPIGTRGTRKLMHFTCPIFTLVEDSVFSRSLSVFRWWPAYFLVCSWCILGTTFGGFRRPLEAGRLGEQQNV